MSSVLKVFIQQPALSAEIDSVSIARYNLRSRQHIRQREKKQKLLKQYTGAKMTFNLSKPDRTIRAGVLLMGGYDSEDLTRPSSSLVKLTVYQ